MALPNRRTFSLQTPADLYRKLNFEALELHNNPPDDLEQRAYAVMNAITTAWQMKDWVYEALREAGELNRLNEFAGRIIRGKKDFGTFLCESSPWMNVCFQLATAAKHFDVGQDAGIEVLTTIEFQVAPETTPSTNCAGRMKSWSERPATASLAPTSYYCSITSGRGRYRDLDF
ncbi:hypothetical protein SAMN05216466_10136 [Paraburkholderia phenazinium]|uniref:Uncharacterized protein n=1 Tax=Paraburkholderia phenazinium TaxID=60549 RepID=A0A1G7NUI4_9BURK|nr:hypothetical protein [Paraburkholderia phenazinium]SDF77577.1 hypothetical protein SAMN05216466_10136 [Paraburkholderia phenazinium]